MGHQHRRPIALGRTLDLGVHGQCQGKRPQGHQLQIRHVERWGCVQLQPRDQRPIQHPLAHQLQPARHAAKPGRTGQQPIQPRQQGLVQQVATNPGHAAGQAMGAAAQPQQPHRGGAAKAAGAALAQVALQVEISSQGPVAPAHRGLAQAEHGAGVHGAAAQLQQIQQANVLQQLRQAVVPRCLGRGVKGEHHGKPRLTCCRQPPRARPDFFVYSCEKAATPGRCKAGIGFCVASSQEGLA
jgi:hypothetical protein